MPEQTESFHNILIQRNGRQLFIVAANLPYFFFFFIFLFFFYLWWILSYIEMKQGTVPV